jgi:hypothetical protein
MRDMIIYNQQTTITQMLRFEMKKFLQSSQIKFIVDSIIDEDFIHKIRSCVDSCLLYDFFKKSHQ